jgi:hypothetical protein
LGERKEKIKVGRREITQKKTNTKKKSRKGERNKGILRHGKKKKKEKSE